MQLSHWLQLRLPQVWTERGPFAWFLWPVSLVYGRLLALRRLLYRVGLLPTHRLPTMVIVVGNVVAGGAGKTPVTIALVKRLMSQGLRVGVISRGHGRQSRDTRAVLTDSRPEDVGDEPLLIHQSTGAPVWVGAARAEAGRQLIQAHPNTQVIVCDDGLQHLALARDIEICVMDERGAGNGWLLPAGPLREAWPRPVDLLVHSGPPLVPGGFQMERQLADHVLTREGQKVPMAHLKNIPVNAVAGLAKPQAFFQMLRQAGLQLDHTLALPDHHDYRDWQSFGSDKPLLCTQKDAAKLWPHEPAALTVPLQIKLDTAFWTALDALVAQRLKH